MKFNLGDQVRIKSNGVVGIIIARGYNEYLDENDKQQSFEEYQIESDKYYQCNEDGIELCNPIIEEGKDTMNKIYDSILNIKPISDNRVKYEIDSDGNMFKLGDSIKEMKCDNCCEFIENNNFCDFYGINLRNTHSICEEYHPKVQEVEVENDPVNPFMEEYERIVNETVELCKRKNADYGSSVQDTYEKFGDVSYLVRITDKYNRICFLLENKKVEVRDESITDTIVDLANYCFLWASSRSLKGDK